MKSYFQQAADLASRSSVAVMILMNDACDDIELLPLRPKLMTDNGAAELLASWPGRGLRSIGVAGLVGAASELCVKEPIPANAVYGLAYAFQEYCRVLLFDRVSEASAELEVQELSRLWQRSDTRLD